MDQRSLGVLFPLRTLGRSGGVRMICAVANELAARGVTVTIAAPEIPAHPPFALHPEIVQKELETQNYPRRFAAAVRKHKGVVVATGYLTPAMIFLASPRDAAVFSLVQNAEIISHIRYGRRPRWLRPFLGCAARFGYRIPARRVAVSEFVADQVGRRRIAAIIHPGIADEFTERIPVDDGVRPRSEPFRIGMFPGTGVVKGTRFAIEAFEQQSARDSSVAFVVYDVDFPAEALPAGIHRYLDECRAARSQPSIVDFYSTCDVFLFPSLVEGFGLPPLEAMACGAAVITTDCGGISAYARHEENAIIVPTADSASIVRAVHRLASDESLRRRLVSAGYTTARQFPEAAFARRCADEIVALLN